MSTAFRPEVQTPDENKGYRTVMDSNRKAQEIKAQMVQGSGEFYDTVDTVRGNCNPFQAKSWGFILPALGLGAAIWIGWEGLLGAVSARNPQPLPYNASLPAKVAYSTFRGGAPLARGVGTGISVAWSGMTQNADQMYRTQLVMQQYQFQVAPGNSVQPNVPTVPTRVSVSNPLNDWLGNSRNTQTQVRTQTVGY